MSKLKIIMLGESLWKTPGGIAEVQKLILQQATAEVQIQHVSTQEDGSIASKVVVFGWAVGEFLWRLLRREADLVHIHVTERGSVLRKVILTLIALMFHKPVILHAHASEFQPFYFKLPEWAKQVLNWTFGQCAYFIVLSESWKDFYMSTLGLKAKQVVVLTNPVEFPLKVPVRIGSKQVNFVFLGRIGQRKGAFDLIKAFATLSPEQRAKSQVIMAGDGDAEEARKFVESLNLIAHITILDWVKSEQRNNLLAKADVFVLPSYNEGLPMALLEAMSWGLPVITTPVGGIPEVVTHRETGLLVSPGDIQQLSKAMESLIENEDVRLSLGSAARTRVAPLDVKNYVRSLIYLYHSILTYKD